MKFVQLFNTKGPVIPYSMYLEDFSIRVLCLSKIKSNSGVTQAPKLHHVVLF